MIGFLSSVWKGQNHFVFLLKFRIHLRATIILATISVFCCLGFNGSESVSLIISIWEHLKIQCNAIAAVGVVLVCGEFQVWKCKYYFETQLIFFHQGNTFFSRVCFFRWLGPGSWFCSNQWDDDSGFCDTTNNLISACIKLINSWVLILHLYKTDRTDK